MFQRNEDHRQQGLFDGARLLPEKLRDRLESSWAETFYREVFCRIDEEIFADLYSEKASRPNVPVNVLVALEVLKSGFGWSDRELYNQLCFNLQMRHAVGLTDLGEELFELRTVYNFRRRVRKHMEETGEDLFGEVFRQVTDAQLEAIETETQWQRVDSTQVMSDVAQQSRLELVISVVQEVWDRLAERLSEAEREQWAERLSPYVEERPHEISYEIPTGETEEHLCRLGEHLAGLLEVLREEAPESEARRLAERTLREQYHCEEEPVEEEPVEEEPVEEEPVEEEPVGEEPVGEEPVGEEPATEEGATEAGEGETGERDTGESPKQPLGGDSVKENSVKEDSAEENDLEEASSEGPSSEGPSFGGGSGEKIRPRSSEQISAESLQSPHDRDATYRRKGGEEYPGGYVVGISETCDPEAEVQLITDVQVAPNTTDDQVLLKRSLEEQSERGLAIGQVTCDGGYTGPEAEQACSDHEVKLRPTRIRGGKSGVDRLGWEDYEWTGEREGRPTGVVCPEGKEGTVEPGEADGRLIARFDPGACEGCPLLGEACRVEKRRKGPTMYVSERSVQVARMRQGLREEDRSVRAPVEATMRSVKRGLKRGPQGDKLPTRGVERARMVMSGAALMVNMRRLHRRREQKREESRSEGENLLFLAFLVALGVLRRKVRGRQVERPDRRTELG